MICWTHMPLLIGTPDSKSCAHWSLSSRAFTQNHKKNFQFNESLPIYVIKFDIISWNQDFDFGGSQVMAQVCLPHLPLQRQNFWAAHRALRQDATAKAHLSARHTRLCVCEATAANLAHQITSAYTSVDIESGSTLLHWFHWIFKKNVFFMKPCAKWCKSWWFSTKTIW